MPPGLMFVASSVVDPNRTSDALFTKFYNEEHLPDVIRSGRTRFALRYKSTNPDSTMPYMAIYPVEDYHQMDLEENLRFAEQTRQSFVFEGADVFDLVNFEIRPYVKIQTFEGWERENETGWERGKTMVCVATEPGEGKDREFEEWSRKQQLPMLSMCRGYQRCTRYKRFDAAKPRYLALHEWDCEPEDLPTEQLKMVEGTEWAREVIGEAQIWEEDVFYLIHEHGATDDKI
ncbi:uncharacterized protein BCR38DRAFT_477628 [Pseudomassariella vexata]|uniref:EthD domain-containing protein n=1 Tax=Pseudomassariella vexata TaxID=1141098 RepID=A0A1Y2DHS5_9PEZI|nr:uncharacterized protein BCR38DRAFT_477628 [Pseudomassariella vexata]ORY58789.1 hypothetical protein BCR38DRAFT_477628 [Pseudomassariella vexata]